MRLRPFLNCDPPKIAALWSRQPPIRGLAQPITAQILESHVFSKPYFEPAGLVVAENEGEILGFVHAGFGPNEDQSDISTELGVTCMLMVAPEVSGSELAASLLEASEGYLRERGAKVLYAGGIAPLNPFYLGMYGGSELPGILLSDHRALQMYQSHAYREIGRCVIMRRCLQGFRGPIDRRQLQLRRKYRVELETAPPAKSWWEACAAPPTEPTRFELHPVDNGDPGPCGAVSFWLVEPLSSSWGEQTVGLTGLQVRPTMQRRGLATFLNSEALKHLQMAGVASVEVQTMQNNTAAIGLYKKLGFQEVDEGLVLRKQAEPSGRESADGTV